ncbi:MAG: TonB-dependent receptor domain-containing protein, partial [Burkholderiales bacterium]
STVGAGANTGFFQNVAKTRRQGLELGLQGRAREFRYSANYGYTRSTFETDLAVSSPHNSTNVGGDIQVRPGNKVPGIPEHTAKIRLAYEVEEDISVGTSVVYSGDQYARGDENNQDANGKVPGYTLVHLDGYYQISPALQLFFRVQNLFDKKYETFGILGANFFSGPNRTFDSAATDEQFRSAGAPRAAWVGIKYAFGARRGTAFPQPDD